MGTDPAFPRAAWDELKQNKTGQVYLGVTFCDLLTVQHFHLEPSSALVQGTLVEEPQVISGV